MNLTLRTNRDLYLAIDQLAKKHAGNTRSLETYLLAVLDLSQPLAKRDSITLEEFRTVLANAFTHESPPFNEAWREQYEQLPHEEDDFAGWRATVIRQIVDLREMEECGTLNNEMRYYGVYAPRGSYWYNFDPNGYLECAMAGTFGGWRPGDDTGRQYVPGPVAVLNDKGEIESAKPQDLPNPVFEIPEFTWKQFKDFVICGQIYE